jgi:hypothetical protein
VAIVIWLHNLFQLQYFNLTYNIFNPWLQYVLSAITICSFRGYNIFNPWLQSKLAILIDDRSAPRGGDTKARMMVVAQTLRSTPHGGGWRDAPRSAPRWLADHHSGDEGSAVRSSSWEAVAANEERALMDHRVEATARTDPQAKP